MKSDLNRLHKLVNKQEVSKIRTKEELANTLNIDVNLIEQLKVYYNSKHLKTKISVSDFVNFINKSVLTDKEYAKIKLKVI